MYKLTVPVYSDYPYFNAEDALQELQRCRAERVALILQRNMDYAFSSPESLKKLAEHIGFFKDNGFEVLVWVGETIGHSSDIESAPTRYQNIHAFSNGRSKALCPLDKNFQRDLAGWMQDIAKAGADIILLDDDYRTDVKPDNALGCACPLHIERLEKELGEKLSADTLWKQILDGGNNKYRNAWRKVQKDSMIELSMLLRAAVNEVSPHVRLGFCACLGWDTTGADLGDIARALAGDTTPLIRLSGAPYWPRPLGECIEFERWQNALYKEQGMEIISEGDTYPRPRFVTSAARLECFDTALRADGTNDGILKYMIDYIGSVAYETGYIDAHQKHQSLYEQIDTMFSGKTASGVRLCNDPDGFTDAHLDVTDPNVLYRLAGNMYFASTKAAIQCSLPTAYEGDGVRVVFGENARHIALNELDNGCILDIPAARILLERGVDVGISEIKEISLPSSSCADVVFEYYIEQNERAVMDGNVTLYDVIKKEGAKVLTQLVRGKNNFDGAFTYENAASQRFLVFPFAADKAARAHGYFAAYTRRRQLLKELAWLGNPLLAYVEGNYPYHYSMVKEDEKEIAVGIWNLFEDKMEDVSILINEPFDTKQVAFVNCEGYAEGQRVYLKSKIYPYEFAGVLVKKK